MNLRPLILWVLWLSVSAQAAGISRYQCFNDNLKGIFSQVAKRASQALEYATSLRSEDKKFSDPAGADGFKRKIVELRYGRPPEDVQPGVVAKKAYGLTKIARRDVPPPGKVFKTITSYIAASFGKFRGRNYFEGIETDPDSFKIVQLGDEVTDPVTGKPKEYIKMEMKVRREGTEEEPYLNKVVDKPGIVMFKDDFEKLVAEGSNLSPEERKRIYDDTMAIARKGKSLNNEKDVNFMFKSYEDFYREYGEATGGAKPGINARVDYMRDAYEYTFARKDVPLPPGYSSADLPAKFTMQHTVDRDIHIQDTLGRQTAEFGKDTRANEIKIPLGYAKLYMKSREDPALRQWLIDSGLQDFVKALDYFYDTLKTKEVPEDLQVAGFGFVDGKGKLSTGSKLLKATVPSTQK